METTLERLCELNGFSRITQQDEETFRQKTQEQRPKRNKDFKDSWAYIVQASRNLPYKIETQGGLFFLGAKEDESAIVIPNYFATNKEVGKTALEIQEITGLPVVLKNVNPIHVKDLEEEGFRGYLRGEEWSDESHYDDQTFPEQVVNIEELIRLRGNNYDCLRQELTSFSRKNP
ncbi:MAG: hypothetical protein KC506_00960, partial [Nanoarchaeota archaeon]|nr:hypothetical protein [Nanoarchaeota archaeon]